MAEEKGLVDAYDDFIECIIYHRMWDSEACWKTITDVTTVLRRIKTKSGKVASLKDNIRIRWKGLGLEECETMWTVLGHDLKITELANHLKELIKMRHKYKWVVPEKPAVLVPQRKNIVFLGTATRQVGVLNKKAKEGEDNIGAKARVNWKGREEGRFGSVHSSMQRTVPPDLESTIGERISYLCSIDMYTAVKVKELVWMNGNVMRVSDGNWIVGANARTNSFKAGEATEVFWDAVPKVNYPASKSIKEFKPNLWNRDKLGA